MQIEGCQLSQIIQGTQDFGPYLPQPCLQGSLLPFPMEKERERPWFDLATWLQNKIEN